MNAPTSELAIERDGPLTRLTIARPEKANALNATLVEGLLEAVERAHEDSTRLLVLRGSGKHFSAGFDFTGFEDLSEAELLWRFVRVEQLLQALYHAPFATLAFAHGKSFGAGADLFATCETRIATPEATFRMPGLQFGLQLGTRRLVARIGADAARTMLAGSLAIDSTQAHSWHFTSAIATIDQWTAIEASSLELAMRLAPDARARLHRATLTDSRAADMADLVASVTEPGVKDRIRAYRSGA